MKVIIKHIALISVLLCCFISRAQDIHFTHIFNTNIITNPGKTGLIYGNQRAVLSYRDQWTTAQSPYKTYFIAADAVLGNPKKANIGIGFHAFKDVAGDLNIGTSKAMISIAAILPAGERSKISLGLQGGYALQSIDKNGMMWDAQYTNGKFNSGTNSGETDNFAPFGYADLNAGIIYSFNSKNQYNMGMNSGGSTELEIGLAAHHLLEPKFEYYSVDENRLNRKYLAHFNGVFNINGTNYAINPAIIYTKQGQFQELGIGTMVRITLKEASKHTRFSKDMNISAGGLYRYNDAFIPSIFFEYDKYSIGFNFGLNHSYLRKATNSFSGFEIMLRFINF